MSSRVEQKATVREKAARIRAEQRRAERRRLLVAGGAVVVVVAIVAGLVVAKITGAGSGSGGAAATQADSGLVKALGSVPASAFDAAGTAGVQGGPQPIKAPPLTSAGKPKVLYIGAEYCPYCAAERWPVAVALSRFGTFSNLGTTHSATQDVYPNTPTLSFHGARLTSKYLALTGVETSSNKLVNGQYAPLDTPSAADRKTLATYNKPPYVTTAGSIPFIDIAGKYVSSGATYNPQVLAGMTQAQVAAALADPSSPVAKAVLPSANIFTAALCRATGNQPTAVCTSKAVTAASAQLGKG